MKSIGNKFIAGAIASVFSVTSLFWWSGPAHAGIPVIDASNLSQNIVTAMENVAHTAMQIQQYQTQLQQYENMLRNTTQPRQQIWDSVTVTMNQLRSSIDTLNYYKNNLGSIDAYLAKFQDTAAYRSSPCFSPSGCTPDQWAAMNDTARLGSDSQKRANDALFRSLDRQQEALVADARQLERLQAGAKGASGQLEAIGYANQFASQQATQLLQIRALLAAEQNALGARNQALSDREARETAAHEFSASTRSPNELPGKPLRWKP